ncbi:S-layer homology domain-containing protein [Thermus sp.]|uniref:S-layer homology domain-containing protein n=1 Tax=Thermus sp. TaxID=275 RepID=UPI003D14559C
MKGIGLLALSVLGGLAWAAFSDVPQGPLTEQVEAVVRAGWIQGYPDGTFRGHEVLNRYQLGTVLGRVLKDLGVEGKPVAFKDVPPGHWALEPLSLAVAWGLVTGYPDGTFRGQEPLNRAALAAVLARILERLGVAREALLPWDVSEVHWAAPAVRRVVGAGLMDLNPDGSFGLEAPVNRYQMARVLAALRSLLEGLGKLGPKTQEAQPSPPSPPRQSPGTLAPAVAKEPLDLPASWVGMARGQVWVVGEKAWLWAAGEAKEAGPAGAGVALPPWRLQGGVLEDGKNRYVPLGAGGGKEVLPPVLRRMGEGHLALDPSGNYLLLVNARPLCDCPSRVVRLVLLLSNPVGLYEEYAYLLDGPEAEVAGVAWPDPKNLLVLEAQPGSARLYRVDLNAGEDIAFSAWDEGGLEERNPIPVRPVDKVLLAELPLSRPKGLALEDKDRLLTVMEDKLQRIHLPSALW